MAHCTKAVLRRQVKVKVTYPPASSAQSCGRSPSCLCPARVSTAARTAGCWRSETCPQPSAEIYRCGCMVKRWTWPQTFSQTCLRSNTDKNALKNKTELQCVFFIDFFFLNLSYRKVRVFTFLFYFMLFSRAIQTVTSAVTDQQGPTLALVTPVVTDLWVVTLDMGSGFRPNCARMWLKVKQRPTL